MIEIGATAPTFTLSDHLRRKFNSADHVGKSHLLVVFYPLDFTPT